MALNEFTLAFASGRTRRLVDDSEYDPLSIDIIFKLPQALAMCIK